MPQGKKSPCQNDKQSLRQSLKGSEALEGGLAAKRSLKGKAKLEAKLEAKRSS